MPDAAVVQWSGVTHHGVPTPTQRSTAPSSVCWAQILVWKRAGRCSKAAAVAASWCWGLHGLVGLVFRKGGTFRIEDAPSHVVEGTVSLHDASQTLVKLRAGFHTRACPKCDDQCCRCAAFLKSMRSRLHTFTSAKSPGIGEFSILDRRPVGFCGGRGIQDYSARTKTREADHAYYVEANSVLGDAVGDRLLAELVDPNANIPNFLIPTAQPHAW